MGTAPSLSVSGRSVSSAHSTGSATAARICSSAAQIQTLTLLGQALGVSCREVRRGRIWRKQALEGLPHLASASSAMIVAVATYVITHELLLSDRHRRVPSSRPRIPLPVPRRSEAADRGIANDGQGPMRHASVNILGHQSTRRRPAERRMGRSSRGSGRVIRHGRSGASPTRTILVGRLVKADANHPRQMRTRRVGRTYDQRALLGPRDHERTQHARTRVRMGFR
jgi:hypothetical protein